MKQQTNDSGGEGKVEDDRLIDSLLVEHARLGRADDNELIKAVLRETVAQATPSSRTMERVSPPDRSVWLGLVAVLVGIGVVASLLTIESSRSTMREESPSQRKEVVFRVMIDSDEEGESVSDRIDRRILISSRALVGTQPPVSFEPAGEGPQPRISLAEVEAITPDWSNFRQSVPRFTGEEKVESTFTLAANEVTRSGGKSIYSGDVILRDGPLVFRADSVVIKELSGGSLELQALNPVIKHSERDLEARADTASYDPATRRIRITGSVSIVQNGRDLPVVRGAEVVFDGDDIYVESNLAAPPSRGR